MAAAVGWVGASSGGRVRLRTGRARATLVRAGLMGCSGLIAGLAIAAALMPPAVAPPPPSAAGPKPAWVAVEHPLQLFALAGSPYARLRLDYQARRRFDGGARQDILTYGDFAGSAPFLRLTLEHAGTVAGTPDLLVTVARVAGSAGIAVLRAGQPDALPSRFGLMAAAPMTLGAGAGQRQCLGFRLEGRPPVALAGLACSGGEHGPDRAELACALDRLTRSPLADDAGLRAFFGGDRPRDENCAGVEAAHA